MHHGWPFSPTGLEATPETWTYFIKNTRTQDWRYSEQAVCCENYGGCLDPWDWNQLRVLKNSTSKYDSRAALDSCSSRLWKQDLQWGQGAETDQWPAKTGWFRAQNISKWPNICGSPCYWALLEGWDGATFSALRPRPGQLWPGMSKAKPPVWESAGTALRLAWLEMIWMGWTLWSPYSGMGYQKNRASNQRFLETIMNCLWFGTLLTRWLGGLQSLGSCWSQHQIWGDISIFLGFATFFLDFFGISNLSYHMFFWRYELVEILLCKWHLHSEWFHWRLFHSW